MASVAFIAGCSGGITVPTSSEVTAPAPSSPCVIAAEVTSSTVALAGGSTTLTVTTERADCQWHVAGPEWVTFVGAVTRFGSGDVVIRAGAAAQPRTATIAVGGRSVQWNQQAADLAITAKCRESQIGVFGGPCNAFVERAEVPASTGLKVTADLAQFGAPYRDDWSLVYCGCGAWDMDLRIREPFAPGTYTVRFHVTDAQGRSATTTAPLVVVR